MTTPTKYSIPTEYNGRTYRSKLEADYARTFDTLGIEYEYEKVGHYFGDVFYLPDFWLPRSRQYVEVKGVFQPDDCRKIRALLAAAKPRKHTEDWVPDIPIIACIPNGVFYGWERTAKPVEDWYEFLTKSSRELDLFACRECRGWWFGVGSEGFKCQCCGAWDGDHHLATTIGSPFREFPNVHALHFLAPNH